MKTFSHYKNDYLPEINQEEVNKFYYERQITKKRFNPLSNLEKKHDDSHNSSFNHDSFKNLYRRKSLMHKLKEDESMFTSFNNSVDYEKPMSQSQTHLRKSTHRTMHENTLTEQNSLKTNQNEQNVSETQHHSSLEQQQISFYETGSSESFVNRLKRRSNSVQIQTTQMNLYAGVRDQKGTVPLSTILKKYQEEVSKLEKEGPESLSSFMSFENLETKKEKQKNIQILEEVESNKENFETFNPKFQEKLKSKISDKEEKELPQIVQKCIDKWRDLEIGQLRAERLYNKTKDIDHKDADKSLKNNFIQTSSEQFHQNKGTQTNLPVEAEKQKSEDYEKILKEKDDYIIELQKQNGQYKKFVQSIQKMRLTLEEFECQKQSSAKRQKSKESKSKNEAQNAVREEQISLKELWRWIKSLPVKKSNEGKRQSIR